MERKKWHAAIHGSVYSRGCNPRDDAASRIVIYSPRTPEFVRIAAEAVNEARPARGNYPPQLAVVR